MLPILTRTQSCARLTQAFARFNLGSSRAYAAVPPAAKEKKPRKTAEPKIVLDASNLPPKRPVAPFAKYIIENKDKLLKEGGMTLKQLSTSWHELTPAEKKKYGPTAQEMERYYETLTQWKENVDPKILTEINKRRKAKNLKPIQTKKKHPPNSYALFFADFYAQKKSQQDVVDIPSTGREAAEKWRSLSDEEKQVYKDKSTALKEEYARSEAEGKGSA